MSVNVASGINFMLCMAYPPPGETVHYLKKALESHLSLEHTTLDLSFAMETVDRILQNPIEAGTCALFVIQNRLVSSHPEKILLALELLNVLMNNCGISFVNLLNNEFLSTVYNLLKVSDFSNRTISGGLKNLIFTKVNVNDPRILRVRNHVLYYLHEWHSCYPDNIGLAHIYSKIVGKGYSIPRELDEMNHISGGNMELSGSDYVVLLSIIEDLKGNHNTSRALENYYLLEPKLKEVKANLLRTVHAAPEGKLSKRSPSYVQLKAITDADNLVRRLNGANLMKD